MITRIKNHLVSQGRDYQFFLLAQIFLGLALCIDASAFNNYLKDVYQLGVDQRTFLEFPREVPGLLASVFIALLAVMGDLRITVLANVLAAVGFFALGIIPPVYGIMLLAVFIYSTGQHIFMPLSNTIGMGFAKEGQFGKVLGRISAANTTALVLGSLVLFTVLQFVKVPYVVLFSLGGAFFLGAAMMLFFISPEHIKKTKVRWVFKKEYGRFYIMSVLWGARKQIFLTFAPWMLVDYFHQGLSTMTGLFFTIAILGIFIKPLVGRLTDSLGTKKVLSFEALLMVGVTLVYAFAPGLLPAPWAFFVIALCYVLDQSSSSVTMARAIYVRKIALVPEDVSPTLSLGVSLDHVTSILFPVLGGMLWYAGGKQGYIMVFLLGTFVALVNYFVVRGIKNKE
ncbi:MAG: hypothetical protein A2Z96_03880 [Spirochaetes bacterium GWB1_48_6]|nr:MAG: hypothetical protein A2Z96_03880 [Spirochaetes bacterium GWB1_48_6]